MVRACERAEATEDFLAEPGAVAAALLADTRAGLGSGDDARTTLSDAQ